jgi:hypothetical protein
VRRLELENRLHRAALGALVILGTNCGGITSSFELVRTQRLVVVDSADRPQMSLGPGPVVTFHDAAGDVRLDAATLRVPSAP